MNYIEFFNIKTFKFWGGAVRVIEYIRDCGAEELELAVRLIESKFAGETPASEDINSYVWFELLDDMETADL